MKERRDRRTKDELLPGLDHYSPKQGTVVRDRTKNENIGVRREKAGSPPVSPLICKVQYTAL